MPLHRGCGPSGEAEIASTLPRLAGRWPGGDTSAPRSPGLSPAGLKGPPPGYVHGGMRHTSAVGLVLAGLLWVALPAATGAQPAAMRPVLDPGGRFVISFPEDWHVETSESGKPAVIGAAPEQASGFRVNVNVVVETLAAPASPQALAEAAGSGLRTIFQEYTVVQKGPALIGGRAAYYRYYTWRANTGVSIYQVQVYFTAGQTGFIVTGSTLNDPARVRADLPVIARIVESFRINAPSARGARAGAGAVAAGRD